MEEERSSITTTVGLMSVFLLNRIKGAKSKKHKAEKIKALNDASNQNIF
jgi:hypothetical protein